MSAKIGSLLTALLLAGAATGAAYAANDGAGERTKSADHPNNCRIVERKPGENNSSGSLSTSVTAGNGQVSARSTGGNGVTVHSGNGSVSSSVATTTGSGGSTTVTTSDGNCVIYVNPGEKKDN